MRCLSCNVSLSDFESTRKFAASGEFIDLCNGCFGHIGDFDTTERADLRTTEDVDSDQELYL